MMVSLLMGLQTADTRQVPDTAELKAALNNNSVGDIEMSAGVSCTRVQRGGRCGAGRSGTGAELQSHPDVAKAYRGH